MTVRDIQEKEPSLDELILMAAFNPDKFLKAPLVRLMMATQPGWLMSLPYGAVRGLLGAKTCPKSLLRQFPRKRNLPIYARVWAAARSDYSREEYEMFMSHAAIVRMEVLRNKHCPKELYQRFRYDKGKMLRREFLRQNRADEVLMLEYANDRDSGVRGLVAEYSKEPTTLHRLALDSSHHKVRVTVAGNPNISLRTRNILERSNSHEVHLALRISKLLPVTMSEVRRQGRIHAALERQKSDCPIDDVIPF